MEEGDVNFMGKKVFAVLVIAIMLFGSVSGSFSEEINTGSRDETVYAMLKSDGSVDYLKMVNRLEGKDFSSEYGYEAVEAKELPVILSFKYYIGNDEVPVDKLIGSSGEFKILIGVKQNDSCAEVLKNKYMTQIQLPLNLDKAKIKKFDGTTSVITGATATLSYAVMPGVDADFELVFDANGFEMDSMQIALVEYASDLSAELGGLVDGIHTMGEKAGEMINGTNELKAGMDKLVDGAGVFNEGIVKINSGATGLVKGMKDYSGGMKQYGDGLTAAVAGVDSTYKGLQQISAGTNPLLKGYEDLAGAAEQLNTSHSDLVKLAQKLQSSKDPEIQALCQGIIAEAEGMSRISAGLAQANEGFSGFAAGIGKLEAGAEVLNQGTAALPAGFAQLQTGFEGLQAGAGKLAAGMGEFKKGASSFSDSVKGIPQNVQELVDGQVKFQDGIKEMETNVKEGLGTDKKSETISFTDGKTKINSLQFVMKTPELKKADSSDTGTEITDENQTWVQRIWIKIKELF